MVENFLEWLKNQSLASEVAAWYKLPATPARYSPLQRQEKVPFYNSLPFRPYEHQIIAFEYALAGHNFIVTTSTASGKSLCYIAPITYKLSLDPAEKALVIHPTKALSHDQILKWRAYIAKQQSNVKLAVYDGDTSKSKRKSIRSAAQILFTNPDMLHYNILPHHTKWASFFENLSYIVLDDVHRYSGVFGSHVAQIIRRIKRISRHYSKGNKPLQFFATSATLKNPKTFAENLIGEAIQVISENTAPQNEKNILFINPPIINKKLWLRESLYNSSIKWLKNLASFDLQTLVFVKSRMSAENLYKSFSDSGVQETLKTAVYRSGLLPDERRKIEDGIRKQEINIVFSTNALELGVDFESLDAVCILGYPGSINTFQQMLGRAGRSNDTSLHIFIASQNPQDQYIINHSEEFLVSDGEEAIIDTNNLNLNLIHLSCSTFELPIAEQEIVNIYGYNVLTRLREQKATNFRIYNDKYHFISKNPPQYAISIRNNDSTIFNLMSFSEKKEIIPIGQASKIDIYNILYPGSIYMHGGKEYETISIDFNKASIYLNETIATYFTTPHKETEINIIEIGEEKQFWYGSVGWGKINTTAQINGYAKRDPDYGFVFEQVNISIPPHSFVTHGYWISLSNDFLELFGGFVSANAQPNYYGSNWHVIRKTILARDGYKCQLCGIKNVQLHIHHIKPLRSFSTLEQANHPDNLITLCPRCHRRAETVVSTSGSLAGIGTLLNNLAPLYLRCDKNDIQITIKDNFFTKQTPTLIIYENNSYGVGFAKRLYQLHENLLLDAYNHTKACVCSSGCISCVGPTSEFSTDIKANVLSTLEKMLAIE